MRATSAPILTSTIALILGCVLGCGGGAAKAPSGTAGAGATAGSGGSVGGTAGSGGSVGGAGGSGGSGGSVATTIENVPFPLGARVYATTTAQLQVNSVANVAITVPLFVVGTTDPQSPVKLLTFDPDAHTWAVKYQVNAGGALPQAAHRIDAIAVLYEPQYGAPTLLFSARKADTLENEGLYMATWDPISSGGYKVTLVDGTDVPGRAFVSIDANKISGPIVAVCVDTGAASPKTAAMLWSFDQGTTMTFLGSLPGEPAVDPMPSPIARRPAVVRPQDSGSTAGSALVWQQRKPDGSVGVTVTSFTRTGFGASIDLAMPAGVDLVDNSNGASGGSTAGGVLPDYVIFLGSDGLLYHLEMDVPTANLVLVRGPETATAGTSLAVARFGGGFSNDLVQGGVPGSPGLELQIGRFAPFALFGPRPGPTSSIATGPVQWPIATSFRTYRDINAPPELRTFIFAVTTGASGAYDTALLSIVPPPPPEDDAMACFTSSSSGPPPPQPFTCTLPEPCAVAAGALGGPMTPAVPTLDVAAGKCLLQTLRDGAPAHLTVSMTLYEGAMVEEIWSLGDGTAVLYRHDSEDSFFTSYAPTRLTIRDHAFFDACLQQTGAKAVFHCLFSWWVDGSCASAGAVACPAH